VGNLNALNREGAKGAKQGRRKKRRFDFSFLLSSSRPSRLRGSILILLVALTACGGGRVTPTPVALTAQQTVLAQLTRVPGSPAAPAIATVVPTRQATPVAATPLATASSASRAPTAVPAVPVTETPGLKPLANGTTYTNPAKTYRIDIPPDWSPPAPDPGQAGRIVTRAPKDAVTLTIEEGTPPDDWTRLMPPVIAGILDAQYRAGAPGSILQSAVQTGIRGVVDNGLPTYHFIYMSSANGAPATVERFVTLTFAGAITITTTAAPEVATAMRPTVEGIVGSLVPLKLDAPTPAPLAPSGAAGAITRTPSGLGIALPSGWAAVAAPTTPPGIEFAARSASGDQRIRVVHKAVTDGTKLTDFAATVAGELKATADDYEVDAEDTATIGGVRAVRNLYRATVGGGAVVGQSVALIKGTNGYVISVEVPAAQYDAKPDDAQALFDRIESSVTLP
jgi:hypothetical protein